MKKMNEKTRKLTSTLCATGMTFALVLGMSSAANADAHWANNYLGTATDKFQVNSCGKDQASGEMAISLYGPSDQHEYGTWGISFGPNAEDRFAGTINHISGNGKKLYADFYVDSREKLAGQLDEWKGDLCDITPLPDEVVFTQFVIKTNKKGTKVQTKIRAKYGAIVNEGGKLKQAQFRLNSTAYVTNEPALTGSWLLRSIQIDEDTPLECPGSITVDGYPISCSDDDVLTLYRDGTYESNIAMIPTGEGAYGTVVVGNSDVVIFEDLDDDDDPQAYRYSITQGDDGSVWLEVYKNVFGFNVKMTFEAI
jgi:hypothetical protein